MNRFLACGLLLALLSGVWATRCVAGTDQETNSPSPRIVFESTDLDLGTLTNATSIAGVFKFQNKGDAALHLKVRLGAYSGPPPLLIAPIAPGQQGEIPFHLQCGSTRDKKTKTIMIETDDPRNPLIPLTITVNGDGVGQAGIR